MIPAVDPNSAAKVIVWSDINDQKSRGVYLILPPASQRQPRTKTWSLKVNHFACVIEGSWVRQWKDMVKGYIKEYICFPGKIIIEMIFIEMSFSPVLFCYLLTYYNFTQTK